MNALTVTEVPVALSDTPFSPGFNAVLYTPAIATLQGSDALAGAYTTVVGPTVADAMTQVNSLPKFVKLAAAGTAYLLSGAGG